MLLSWPSVSGALSFQGVCVCVCVCGGLSRQVFSRISRIVSTQL